MSSKTKIITTLFIFLLASVFTTRVSAANWQTQTLDNNSGAGRDTSIAIDSNGKTHISYAYGSFIQYVNNTSGSFANNTLIDTVGTMGGFTSIGLDSLNNAFISYYDSVNGDLKFARVGGTIQTVHAGGNVGLHSSLALDVSGLAHISYFDESNGDLVYATNSSGSWNPVNIDTNGIVGRGTAIAIDSNNKVHIAYYDTTNGDLKYATNVSGSWVTSTLDGTGSVGEHQSIDIDSNNKVHISYYDSTNGDLKYATNASGSWVATAVEIEGNVGEYSSLKVDSNNAVHISYYKPDNGSLKYATNKSGSWSMSSITDAGGGGVYSSLALGSDNSMHVSYQADNEAGLKYSYAAGFSGATVSINSSLPYAFSRQVNLSFTTAGADPVEMIISENSDFSGASWETYAATKTFTLSSGAGTKTVYAKFRNVLGQESQSASDTISYVPKPKFVTKSAKKQNEVLIKKDTTNPGIQDMDLTFGFPKSFAKKKYYLQPVKFAKYPPKYANAKKSAIKKYWQVDTDFNKFKKNLQLEFVYYYTNKEFKALKKKNKSLKEKDLTLKYYDSSAKTWKELTAKHNAKKNSFKVTFKKLLFARTYFGIGK